MARRLVRLVPPVLLIVALAACDAETSLEFTPEVVEGGVCPRPHDTVSGPAANQAWGSVTPVATGIEFTINSGFTATLCAKGGTSHNIITLTGPQSGFLETPENQGGNIPALSHWSVSDVTGSGLTTTTGAAATTTGPPDTTTTTQAVTTTAEGESTSTLAPGGPTTTTAGGTPTTEASGATTTSEAVASTTTVDETTTTSVEVGGGTLQPGQVTTTTGEPGTTTGDPGEETTTTAEESDETEETLPNTGAGGMTTGGLAGVLVAAGVLLLLVTRRRSGAE